MMKKQASKKAPVKKLAKKQTAADIFADLDLNKKPNFWCLSTDVENISMNVERVKDLIETIAESMFDRKSNLLWLAADLLNQEVSKLDNISSELMGIHREKLK